MVKDSKFDILKQKAEELLKDKSVGEHSGKQVKEILHELSVYQIELELQNDELQKSQMHLNEKSIMFEEIFENAPLPYIIIDSDGIISDVNKNTLDIFELDKEYLLDRPFTSFFKHELSEEIKNYLDEVYHNENTIKNKFESKKGLIFELRSNKFFDYSKKKNYCRTILIDITENEKNIYELSRTKDNLNTIINSLDDALFIHKPDGTIIDIWTNNNSHLFMPRSEALGKTHYDIFEKEIADKITGKFSKLIKTGKTQTVEYKSPTESDKYFQTKFTLAKIAGEDVIVSFARDVSDKVLSRIALEKSKLNYQFLSDVTFESIVITENNKIISYNKAAKETFGFSGDVLPDVEIGMKVLPKFRKLVKKMRYEKSSETYEIQMYNNNGEIFWAEISGKSYEQNSSIIRVTSIRDVTKRKNDEILIKKLSTAIEQNPVSIVITNRRAEIEYVNKTFCRITGYDYDELIGKNPKVLQTGRTDKQVYNDMWKTVTKRKIWKGEFYNRKKNGEEFVEYAIISPIVSSNNRITHYIGVKQDITKERQNEQLLLQQNKELNELNSTKDKLFSIIAHDLKNPFTALMNLTMILKDFKANMSEKEFDKITASIHSAAESTYNLLENLLIWAKSQMKGLEFEPYDNNLYEMVFNLVNNIKPTSEQKKIEIIVNVPKDINVYCDRNMLNTVLRNLVTNAVKFSHHNSKVIIESVKEVENIIITVLDFGVGIPEKFARNLFNIKNNFSTKGTDNEKGTGLGLIIAKEFIDIHKGTITVKSEVGKGSKFIISLPKKAD
jgi:PAS domain S-box-containing protein